MKSIRTFLWALCLLLVSISCAQAQTATVSGTVEDQQTRKPVEGATVELTVGDSDKRSATTNAQGIYELKDIPYNTVYELTIRFQQADPSTVSIAVNQENVTVPTVSISTSTNPNGNMSNEDLIPTVTISESESQSDKGGTQNVVGLLASSQDVFTSAAAFTFGPMRFRIRGYDAENSIVSINGMPMNELETGRPVWSAWGGLNDVMRNRENSIGLQATENAFGSVGGSVDIDMRPSSQRKQIRVGYAMSNRLYAHRLMATYSSGALKGGWYISASASWRFRFGNVIGYMPGTDYNAASYFLAIEKKIGEKHSLTLTGFGTPTARGKTQPTFQELYDLMGTNYYNPNWGYQTNSKGKQVKRNSREAVTHQPVIMLNHDWKINDKMTLSTTAGAQFGRNGATALDWYDSADPRPDYYRKLPSYYYADGDSAQAQAIEQAFLNDPSVSQINWDRFYSINRANFAQVADANGVAGDTVSGNRSLYVVEDRRFDTKRATVASNFIGSFTDFFTLHAGVNYQWYATRNFKVLDDLLGGDYYLDIDKFAERDSVANPDFYQSDINTPNRIVKEGDVFGYDYTNNIHKTEVWAQGVFTFPKVDFFVAGNFSHTEYWRTGNIQNGKFPDNSSGNSEKAKFDNFAVKGGLTYKINGRNYLFANGMYMTRAPFMRDVFISPRTRNQLVDSLQNERVYSVEAGYRLRSPRIQLSVTGYFTRFFNQLSYSAFYLDNALRTADGTTGGFVNYVMRGINKQHMGLEVGFEIPIVAGLAVNGAASVGEYIYISRPQVSVYLDNTSDLLVDNATAYLKNFYVGGAPQMAYTLGLSYNAPQFWFVRVNANYFMRNFVDINPERRTWAAVSYGENPVYQQNAVEQGSELWNQIIGQEELKGGFTLDIFGGKSFRIKAGKKTYMLYLNLGVSNVLHNTKLVTGAYEQFRFDYEDKNVDKFPSRYTYSFGANYFLNISLQI